MYKFGLLLLASYVCSTAALPPCVCARDFHPVCGSDGQTYPNDCMLNCATTTHTDLKLIHRGSCNEQPSCICTYEYKPVCGIDDTTYPNECALGCEKARNPILEKQYDGPCKFEQASDAIKVVETPKLPSCTCTRNFSPVCGSDGVTYANPCLLDCAAQNKPLEKKSDGPCDGLTVKVVSEDDSDAVKVAETPNFAACTCTRNVDPVCGSDGVTYANPCALNCAAQNKPLEKKADGPCDGLTVKVVSEDDSDAVKVAETPNFAACTCTRNLKPVCGSDGVTVTYANPCALNCAAQNKPLEKKADGPCDGLTVKVVSEDDSDAVKVAETPNLAACACTRNLKPVCGSDGVTYNNPCLLNCAAQNKPLVKKADGPCNGLTVKVVEQPKNSCVCTRNYKPVCGSDGTTYANPCVLGCKSNSVSGLTMIHDGPC